MQGPFIATVDIGSPFQLQSEPYTITTSTIVHEPQLLSKRSIWPAIIVVCAIVAFVIILALRKRATQ